MPITAHHQSHLSVPGQAWSVSLYSGKVHTVLCDFSSENLCWPPVSFANYFISGTTMHDSRGGI